MWSGGRFRAWPVCLCISYLFQARYHYAANIQRYTEYLAWETKLFRFAVQGSKSWRKGVIMTSLERRHEKRYQRRKAMRDAKKQQRYTANDHYENIISYRSLYNANRQSMKSVSWKASVQRYQMNLLRNIHDTHRDLADGKDKRCKENQRRSTSRERRI